MLSAVLRAGHEPTAGLFHLSTPDSILMSYVNFSVVAGVSYPKDRKRLKRKILKGVIEYILAVSKTLSLNHSN